MREDWREGVKKEGDKCHYVLRIVSNLLNIKSKNEI